MASTVPVPEDDHEDHPLKGGNVRRFADQPTVASPTGLQLPSMGLGTWRLKGSTAREMVTAAIETGYRHIDTAQMYGNEREVGAGITDAGADRSEIFLTTKVDNDKHEPAALVASVESSLERLATDYVDLLLLHWPVEWDTIGATLAAMTQVHAAGRAHHIGVCNFTVGQLETVAGWAPLEVLQVECHPFLQQRELRDWCRDHELLFTAYSPLAQGAVMDEQTLRQIGERHGATAAEVSLAWLMSKDGVAVIPRTADREHLASNWRAGALHLSREDIAAIDDLDRGQRLVDPGIAPW